MSVTGQPGVTARVTVPATLSTVNAGPALVPLGESVVACSSFPSHAFGSAHVCVTAGLGGPVLAGQVGMLCPGISL